jgi:hypothetical protein
VYNRFHRGELITWASGGEGALDTPGPLNGNERRICRKYLSVNGDYMEFGAVSVTQCHLQIH